MTMMKISASFTHGMDAPDVDHIFIINPGADQSMNLNRALDEDDFQNNHRSRAPEASQIIETTVAIGPRRYMYVYVSFTY